MSKHFYIIVPYGALILPGEGAASGLLSFFKNKSAAPTAESAAKFEEARSQLEQRISVITGGLESLGITTKMLETADLIELYQKTFNPGELHSTAGALGQ